jgi:hypothetical protein
MTRRASYIDLVLFAVAKTIKTENKKEHQTSELFKSKPEKNR